MIGAVIGGGGAAGVTGAAGHVLDTTKNTKKNQNQGENQRESHRESQREQETEVTEIRNHIIL